MKKLLISIAALASLSVLASATAFSAFAEIDAASDDGAPVEEVVEGDDTEVVEEDTTEEPTEEEPTEDENTEETGDAGNEEANTATLTAIEGTGSPKTGVEVVVIPAAIAGAVMIISKKRG